MELLFLLRLEKLLDKHAFLMAQCIPIYHLLHNARLIHSVLSRTPYIFLSI